VNKILDLIMGISNAIYMWAWRKKSSNTRMNRYKKAKNNKVW